MYFTKSKIEQIRAELTEEIMGGYVASKLVIRFDRPCIMSFVDDSGVTPTRIPDSEIEVLPFTLSFFDDAEYSTRPLSHIGIADSNGLLEWQRSS